MKKYLLISMMLTFGVIYSFGQQEKLLTHFIFDKMSYNPGATGMGINHQICGTAVYRNQWDKFNGAPNSVLANVEGNFSQYFPSGLGLSFYHDAIGYARQNNLNINYSFHLPIADGLLGIGAGVGMINVGMQPDWITPDNIDNDASLPMSSSDITLDANFGVFYQHNKGWYAGISATHLPGMDLKNVNFKTSQHLYAMGGYTWREAFGVDKLNWEGNALIRSDLKFISADINTRFIWDDLIYAGVTYRTSDALAFMVGVSFSGVTIGYSYDMTLNRISDISWGSHEILVRYCHSLPPILITKARNPRYL